MPTDIASTLRARLGLADPTPVGFERIRRDEADGFVRERVEYRGLEGDLIPAFLFTPSGGRASGRVVVHHQHAGQWHLGKSEVAGLAGDEFQAFGPTLARRGLAVLAPDAITFEERRARADRIGTGTEPSIDRDDDWLQHYNAMAYRLLDGDLLMRKCLDDAQRAVSVLLSAADLGAATRGRDDTGSQVGVAGHSFGGLVALYQAALDSRCEFACISGAVCSFEARRREGTGINMFEVVPGLTTLLETHDLLEAIAPRPMLIVSGCQDPYSRDADRVAARVEGNCITEVRVDAGHALDRERFDAIVDWIGARAELGA